MSEFDMDFNQAVRKESRLGGRERENKTDNQTRTTKPQEKPKRSAKPKQPKRQVSGGGSGNTAQTIQPVGTEQENAQLEHTQGRDDVRDGVRSTTSGSSAQSTSNTTTDITEKPRITNTDVDVKQFKEIPNLFTYVGGQKHIVLDDDYKKVQVTGLPEAMIVYHQNKLKDALVGRNITFPWGDYEITSTNKVFTARTSYMRFNLFNGMRDKDALHVILAKQWLVLHHPLIYSEHYDIAMSYQVHNDELDIYAVIYAMYLDELAYYGVKQPKVKDPQDDVTNALYIGLSTLRKMMHEQQSYLREYTEQTNIMQTILLLDRLGLLGGGLPNDMKDFMRVLELNRDNIHQANQSMNKHVQAEKERLERLKRDALRRK